VNFVQAVITQLPFYRSASLALVSVTDKDEHGRRGHSHVRNDYLYVVEFIRLPSIRQPGANGFAFAPIRVPQHVGLLRRARDI
jgi:hypothetical protein